VHLPTGIKSNQSDNEIRDWTPVSVLLLIPVSKTLSLDWCIK
jgi:hypothetical protein